ncbi:MAG: PIN domain-containing protein [Alphaproteobacteria bacterium]|jgi:tRNA(fMet)-specific endonuclease VapC|nr:PIN domain-containing protein [Alphaproteobacteria bacterium]
MKYMLDTDTISYLLKKRSPGIAARMSELSYSQILVSAVTRAELRYGLAKRPEREDLRVIIERFLGRVTGVPWDAEAADVYAGIRHALTLTGRLIGQLDMMIAAHAIAREAVLVTNNMAHFQRIPGPLILENWHVGR